MIISNITGKIICGILGLLIGNIPGLLIGIWIGHQFDKGMAEKFEPVFAQYDQAKAQSVFFEASFEVMGHIAKADGVVSSNEIAAAERIMATMGIQGEKRQQAIEAFNFGKSTGYNLEARLQELKYHCSRSPALIQMFIEIQIVAATADGNVSQPEMQILYRVGEPFGLQPLQIRRLIEMVMAQQSFHGANGRHAGSQKQGPSLAQAYQVLGLEQNASKQEIKKAYRKLMAQHHPDKLVSKGMPEEMIKVATEKSQEIQSAYEMIKRHLGFA